MAELVDWLHHESVTRAATNTASSYVRQDHHLPHDSLEPHITNADRIRSMSDEELAEFINFHTDCENCPASWGCMCSWSGDSAKCIERLLHWLRKEVEDNES